MQALDSRGPFLLTKKMFLPSKEISLRTNIERQPKATPMSFPATLPAAILETILIRLAALFLTGAKNDPIAARDAAVHMLAAYQPKTEDELCVAANLIIFNFQALEALSQAAGPDVPINRALRLRSGAVSLRRESTKAERRLAQLQNPKPVKHAEAAPAPTQPNAKAEQPTAPTQETATVSQAAKAKGISWTKAYEDRQRELRIANSIKRAEAKFGHSSPAAALPTQPIAQAG